MMRSVALALILLSSLALANGCAPASTPVPTAAPPTSTTSPLPPTSTTEPTGTATQTAVPSPTPLPGSVVFPVDTLGEGVPWLPLDAGRRPTTVYYGFNISKPPFNSVLVRQAFAAAVDKQEIAQEATRFKFREVQPATVLTPPEVMGRDLNGEVGILFDPMEARNLLSQAGYGSGEGFPAVTLLVYVGGEAAPGAYLRMAQSAADMWQTNLGVTVQVETAASIPDFMNRLNGTAPGIYGLGWAADYNDPDNFLKELFHSNGQYNWGHFSNLDFDQLVDDAAGITDPARRQLSYIKAEQILNEVETAIIPLFHAVHN